MLGVHKNQNYAIEKFCVTIKTIGKLGIIGFPT